MLGPNTAPSGPARHKSEQPVMLICCWTMSTCTLPSLHDHMKGPPPAMPPATRWQRQAELCTCPIPSAQANQRAGQALLLNYHAATRCWLLEAWSQPGGQACSTMQPCMAC